MTTATTIEPPYRELERVVLVRDVPEAGLRAGDVGTVVWVYGGRPWRSSSSPTPGGRRPCAR